MIDWFGIESRKELREYKKMFNNYRSNYRELLRKKEATISAQAKTIDTLSNTNSELNELNKSQAKQIEMLKKMVIESEQARKSLAQKNTDLVDKVEQMTIQLAKLRVQYEREKEYWESGENNAETG